jgi:hypothetical protein
MRLLLVNDAIYISELSIYPGAAGDKFTPSKLDADFGSLWSRPS